MHASPVQEREPDALSLTVASSEEVEESLQVANQELEDQSSTIAVDTDATKDCVSPEVQSHFVISSSPPRMLGPGIPMPISADPTVPDPASAHNTPPDSPNALSTESDGQRYSTQTVLSAVPSSLFQQLHDPTGLSGLFTPYSQASSGTSSPAVQGNGEEEGVDERDELRSSKSPSLLPQDVEHDADLDADGDIDPDYAESGRHPPHDSKDVVGRADGDITLEVVNGVQEGGLMPSDLPDKTVPDQEPTTSVPPDPEEPSTPREPELSSANKKPR